MQSTLTKYLGIDIGGAHLKCVGLDNSKNVSYLKYFSYKIWSDNKVIERTLNKIYEELNNNEIICGITMSAELCDCFYDRRSGAKFIIEICRKLKFKKFFYTNKNRPFTEKNKIENIISMNWHSIGRLCETKIKNSIIIDFGSTTTDFICIKNFSLVNNFFDDHKRLNNNELLYTGIIRTPLFGIQNELFIGNKKYNLIPEFFSEMSDIYRVKKQINKKIDIGDTPDASDKSDIMSMKRIARNFGFDYKSKDKKKILQLSNKLHKAQMEKIENNLKILRSKFNFSNKTKIIVSGIGQKILREYLEFKNFDTIYLHDFLNLKFCKEVSYHAPALSIALLLFEKNN